jgi:hypothetical protein
VSGYVYRGAGTDTLTPELDEPCACGETMGGYRRHLAAGEEPCQGSRDATNEYHRDYYARRKTQAGAS